MVRLWLKPWIWNQKPGNKISERRILAKKQSEKKCQGSELRTTSNLQSWRTKPEPSKTPYHAFRAETLLVLEPDKLWPLSVQRWGLNKLENNQRNKVLASIMQPYIERASHASYCYSCVYPEFYVGHQPSGTLPVVAWWLFSLWLLRSACQEAVRKTTEVDAWAQISVTFDGTNWPLCFWKSTPRSPQSGGFPCGLLCLQLWVFGVSWPLPTHYHFT